MAIMNISETAALWKLIQEYEAEIDTLTQEVQSLKSGGGDSNEIQNMEEQIKRIENEIIQIKTQNLNMKE